MPGYQADISLRRPPEFAAGSSTSSLSERDQSVASFRSFIKRTPPLPDSNKPLPPFPLMPRRASSSSPPRSRSPSVFGARRSSSIYSRMVDQYSRDDISWRSEDFADEPLPPLPFLQPLDYSASSPQLAEVQSKQALLQPRAYNPVIATPSPTISQASTPPSPHGGSQPLSLNRSKGAIGTFQSLKTVPLDRAIATHHAPGAVHLLPEELRAQTVGRSRSHEPLRLVPAHMLSPTTPPRLPEPPIILDNQGRQRTLLSPTEAFTTANEYSYPSPQSPILLPNDSCPSPKRSNFKESSDQPRGTSDSEEPRGRTRHRVSRSLEQQRYLNEGGRVYDKYAMRTATEPSSITAQYQALVSEPRRQPSGSPGHHRMESDDSVRSHMKLIPQPLFQNKPPAKLPGEIAQHDHYHSVTPYNLSIHTDDSSESVPVRFSNPFSTPRSPFQENTHKRTSTSGSIPISPPTNAPFAIKSRPLQPTTAKTHSFPKTLRGNNDNRKSAFYPHIASRKGKTGRSKIKTRAPNPRIPPMPFMPPQKPSIGNNSGPLEVRPASITLGIDKDFRRRSDASSRMTKWPSPQRALQEAANYVDSLGRTEGVQTTDYASTASAPVSPDSPHLLPSPVRSKPKEIHLGWSDAAKITFDEVVSPTFPPSKSSKKAGGTLYTHIVTPARPLDESRLGLRDAGIPRRKSSILGGLLDSWKESKAEKRREELKRNIRVIPEAPGSIPSKPNQPQRRSSTFGWM